MAMERIQRTKGEKLRRQLDYIKVFEEVIAAAGVTLNIAPSKVIGDALRVFSDRTSVTPDRILTKQERSKTLTYSAPGVEKEAISLFEKAMPHVRKYKLSQHEQVSRDVVYQADKTAIRTLQKFKGWKMRSLNPQTFSNALRHTMHSFGCDVPIRFKELTHEQAFDSLPTDTSSCYPLYQKKGSKRARDLASQELNDILRMVRSSSVNDLTKRLITRPTTVFHRFTTKLREKDGKVERDVKVRQVFGVPFTITLLETVIFRRAMEYCQNRSRHVVFGLTRPQQSIQVQHVRGSADSSGRDILCGDFSGMDQSLSLMNLALPIALLSNMTDYCEGEKEKLTRAYIQYWIHTPIMWSSKRVAYSYCGNISGSLLTSFVNSFTTVLTLYYVYKVLYDRYPDEDELKVLGDDFILVIDRGDNVRVAAILEKFGLLLNVNKSKVSSHGEAISFLGFEWNTQGQPEQSELWYLSRICFPEKFVYVPGYYRIVCRAASILYQIAGGSKIFERVFLSQITELRNMLKKGLDIVIQYLDKSGTRYYVSIPLSKLRILGWRAF